MQSELIRYLRSLSWHRNFRVAIIGVGNELNGDDAIGVLAARRIIRWLNIRHLNLPGNRRDTQRYQGDRLMVVNGGASPESYCGPMRRFAPDVVILLDAAELGEPAGTIKVYRRQDAQGMSGSTHSMPPTLLAQYLVEQIGCEVALVGIQPEHLDFDAPVSSSARRAVRRIVENFKKQIAKNF